MEQASTLSASALPIVNLAAYKFVPLSRLDERKVRLRDFCRELGLKGTILLSPEGINLFVAGNRSSVDALVALLESDAEVGPLELKESPSAAQPFRRMSVKIKREIIPFGVAIDPTLAVSQKISPAVLKEWLDAGRPITLLDVRNNFEFALGTFAGAEPIGINHFREFPAAADRLPDECQDETIVTFCTGGIRCEKAAPYLASRGFRHVYQLEGGILKFFEECGPIHFHGECFVFDDRVALDGTLRETATTLADVCQ
jgi:UPF0176 protein